MGFLSRVEAASTDVIYVEDIYANDPQFKQLIDLVVNLLEKFAGKFKLSEEELLKLFIKQLEKEI
jgi:hypothetical protein